MNAEGQGFRKSFTNQDFNNNQHQDFERRYGENDYTVQYGDRSKKNMGPTGEKFDIRAEADDQVDQYGRIAKGPITMKNGATYTG